MTFIGKRKFRPRDTVYGGGDGGGLSSIDQSEPFLSRFWWGSCKNGFTLDGHQRGSASAAAHQRIEKDIFKSNPYRAKK
jgi:hypothetical protein